MCKEDDNLYKLQIESKGRVGYSSGKSGGANTIHPYKRKRAMEATVSTLTSSAIPDCSESSTDSFDNSTDSPWEDDNEASTSKSKHNPTVIARRLVTRALKSQPQVSQESTRLSSRKLLGWRSTW